MNLGQTMITLGMFILLILSVISANRMILDNNQSQLQMQAIASTASIANDLLLEIMNKPFDQSVADTTTTPWTQDQTGTKITVTSSLTAPTDTLGKWGCVWRHLLTLPDSSYSGNYKSISFLKDVDDYDGYQRIVTYNGINGFVARVKVYYVNPTSPDVPRTVKSFYKKIEVSVTHPQYMNTITDSVAVYSALSSY
jgi:hypothetical protein